MAKTVYERTYVVGNIMGLPLMSQEAVAEDVKKLFGMGGDVTSAVEIDHPYYKAEFSTEAHRRHQAVFNILCECATGTHESVTHSWIRKVHKGYAKVTPGRVNAGVHLATSAKVLVLTKHPVSGANRRGAAAEQTYNMPLRKRLWRVDVARTSALVAARRLRGTTTVILGDLNNIRETKYSKAQIVAVHEGLMWIIVVPGRGSTVQVMGTDSLKKGLHTDHAFLSARIRVTR